MVGIGEQSKESKPKTGGWRKLAKKISRDDADGQSKSSKLDLANVNWDIDSELVIKFMTIPSTQNYTALRKQLQSSSPEWMTEFLSHGGLKFMFSALRQMGERTFVKFADAVLQLEMVRCIKAVLNSRTGMAFVSDSGEMVEKLALGKTCRLGL